MEKELEQLKKFHTKFNSTWQEVPSLVGGSIRDLRISLMKEEMDEVFQAMKEGNIEHIAKEIADVLYAIYGTIGSYGFAKKMPEVFDEVHRSNMTKTPAVGGDTKALKGEGFVKADINSILQK